MHRAVAMFLLLASPVLAQDKALVERGRALLERNCSSCHAIGKDGASALPAATPFRDIKQNYPVEDLADPLAEGIETGHPQMPTRAFAPEDVDAILAYLSTL